MHLLLHFYVLQSIYLVYIFLKSSATSNAAAQSALKILRVCLEEYFRLEVSLPLDKFSIIESSNKETNDLD